MIDSTNTNVETLHATSLQETDDDALPWSQDKSDIWQMALEFYCRQMLKPVSGPYKWLRKKRRHSRDTIEHFRVGWTGKEWNQLYQYLVKQGISKDDMVACGLIRETNGRLHDAFGPKLFVYPEIMRGQIVDWACKDYFSDDKRNIRLQAEHKAPANLFYNQDDLIRTTLIITEGQNDVWSVWDAIYNHEKVPEIIRAAGVIGTWGGPSEAQLTLLKDRCKDKKVYCAFDIGDESGAGDLYAKKVIQALVGVCQVSRLDFEYAVNGSGKIDIDEFLHSDPFPHLALAKIIDDAQDGIEWMIQTLPDEEHALKINALIEPVIETIAKVQDDYIVDFYIDELVNRYKPLKRASITKMLKAKGAKVADNNVGSWGMYNVSDQIFISNNCIFARTKDDKRRVSNFTMKLMNRYLYEDPTTGDQYYKYECVLTNYKGQRTQPVIFAPEERATVQKFVNKSMGCGDFHFSGTIQHLQDWWSFVEEQAEDIPSTYLLQQYGYLKKHKIWLFENCAVKGDKTFPEKDGTIMVDKTGYRSKDVIVYGGDKPMMYSGELPENFIPDVIENYWRMCDGENGKDVPDFSQMKGLLLLGYLAASVYRPEIMASMRCFPQIFAYGERKTGKSESLAMLFRFYGFLNSTGESWANASEASMYQIFAQLCSLPAWWDEHRTNNNRRKDRLYSISRDAWMGTAAGKGGPLKRVSSPVNSTEWISGEDTPDDPATLSRFLVFRFTAVIGNKMRAQGYQYLKKHEHMLSGILIHLIKQRSDANTGNLLSRIEMTMDAIRDKDINDDRIVKNYAIAYAAFPLLGYELDYEVDERFFNYMLDQMHADLEREAGDDVLTKFFTDLAWLISQGQLNDCIRYDAIDNDFYFVFKDVLPIWKKELRARGESADDFKSSTIKDYIIKSHFFIRSQDGRSGTPVKINDKTKRAIRLNMSVLPEHLNECFSEIIDFFQEN